MPSVTCLRLSDVNVICRVTYFQFLLQSALLSCRSARQHSGVQVYPISDIGRCRKFGSVSCTEFTSQGNDFELILTVKMETRHPVEGLFGSKFPAICNHCVVMAAWSRKTLKFCEKFLRFFGKTTPYGTILKILSRKFSSWHRSTLSCSNVVKFFRRKIGEIVRYLVDKKFRLPQTVATARIASKTCQALQQPTMCS